MVLVTTLSVAIRAVVSQQFPEATFELSELLEKRPSTYRSQGWAIFATIRGLLTEVPGSNDDGVEDGGLFLVVASVRAPAFSLLLALLPFLIDSVVTGVGLNTSTLCRLLRVTSKSASPLTADDQSGLQAVQRDPATNEDASRRAFMTWSKTDSAKPYVRALSIATKQQQFAALGPIILKMLGHLRSSSVLPPFKRLHLSGQIFSSGVTMNSRAVSQDAEDKTIEFQFHSLVGCNTSERIRVGDCVSL